MGDHTAGYLLICVEGHVPARGVQLELEARKGASELSRLLIKRCWAQQLQYAQYDSDR